MIRNKHGIQMKRVRGKHFIFRCFEGRYKKHVFYVQEWNDDPFGPIPDYYTLRIFDRLGEEVYRTEEYHSKIRSAELAINFLCTIIDALHKNSYKKGERVS